MEGRVEGVDTIKWISGNTYDHADGIFEKKIPVHIKRMRMKDDRSHLQIEREFYAFGKFQQYGHLHENVARFFGYDTYTDNTGDKFTLLTTERCLCSFADVWSATSSLDSSTKSKILNSFPNRKPILRQSAEAVAFLHSFGIIHRNIKPSNLLFSQVASDRYLVKLTDMHFSKNFKESPQNSGTRDPEWVAPEMLKKGSVLDGRTDCHLLGCLFFYVLSEGKHPFGGNSGRVFNILHGNAVSLTKNVVNIDEPIFNLIQRMVKKERTDRPTVKEVLEDNYFQLVDCYDLYKEGIKPGMCYIFNQRDMINTEGKKEKRNGTDKDRDRLSNTFSALGFDVCVKENLGGDVMDRDIKEIGQRFDSNYKSLVICILSHGKEGCVVGSDWTPVQINSLKYALNSQDCPNLHNKPKIFIIQACQGDYTQWTDQPAPYHAPQNGQQNSDAQPIVTPLTVPPKIDLSKPPVMDMLDLMSTIPGFVSYRKPEGSYFIQSLCKQLELTGSNDNVTLFDRFLNVQREVSQCSIPCLVDTVHYPRVSGAHTMNWNGVEYQYVAVKQTPEMRSSLQKHICFRKVDDGHKGRIVFEHGA